jgi:hypothetical protein
MALQSIAWTTMIVEYAKHQSFRAAIVQTFDGGHPCSVCHMVSKGKNSEKKSDLQSPVQKIDLICVARVTRFLRPFVPFYFTTRNFSSAEITHSPPVPPPRLRLS